MNEEIRRVKNIEQEVKPAELSEQELDQVAGGKGTDSKNISDGAAKGQAVD
jgi:hypothetical protein